MRQESRFLHRHHPNPQGFVVKSCHLKSCAVRPCHLEDMLWVVQGTQGHDDTGERKGPMTKRPESFLKCWRTESLSPKPLALSFHVFRGGKLMKLIRCWFAKLVGRLRSLRGWAFTHGPLPPRAPSKRPTPSTCMCSKLGAFSSQFTGTGQHMHKPSSKSVRISAFPTTNRRPASRFHQPTCYPQYPPPFPPRPDPSSFCPALSYRCMKPVLGPRNSFPPSARKLNHLSLVLRISANSWAGVDQSWPCACTCKRARQLEMPAAEADARVYHWGRPFPAARGVQTHCC